MPEIKQRRPRRSSEELALAQVAAMAHVPEDDANEVAQHLSQAFLRLTQGEQGACLMAYMGIRQEGPLSYVLPTAGISRTVKPSSALVSMSTFGRRAQPELPENFKAMFYNLITNLGRNTWNPEKNCFDTAEERYALCERAEVFIHAVSQRVPSSFMMTIQQAVETLKNGYAERSLRSKGLEDTFTTLII